MEPRRTIHGKHGITDIVFLSKVGEKQPHGSLISRRRVFYMQQIVRIEIDRNGQSVPLSIESEHGLVDRDVIRSFAAVGCRSAF